MTTIGENLKNLREEAGLSLDKLSSITKIQKKYLLRLENNEFEKLPNPVYIRGFIQKWANACNGDSDKLVMQFKRENEEMIKNSKSDTLSEISAPSFIITSKHIILALVIAAALALSAFFYFNQKLVSEIPQVEITVPADFNTVTEKETVFIRGEAKNTSRIFINGTEVAISQEGVFEFTHQLVAGLNTIIVRAESPAGREIETARKVLKL